MERYSTIRIKVRQVSVGSEDVYTVREGFVTPNDVKRDLCVKGVQEDRLRRYKKGKVSYMVRRNLHLGNEDPIHSVSRIKEGYIGSPVDNIMLTLILYSR